MPIFKTKKRIAAVIIICLALALIIYMAVNYKEVKQNFINGLNDGKAEKAKEQGK